MSTVCDATLSVRVAASSRCSPASPNPHSQTSCTALVATPRPFSRFATQYPSPAFWNGPRVILLTEMTPAGSPPASIRKR